MSGEAEPYPGSGRGGEGQRKATRSPLYLPWALRLQEEEEVSESG